MREAFVTGSRAYGTPRADSDLDLVVRVSEAGADALRRMSDNGHGYPCRYGRLNLIIVTDDDQWIARKAQHIGCRREAPVTRERAIEIGGQVGCSGAPSTEENNETPLGP